LGGSKGKILLVEDDRALVELLVFHFERARPSPIW